MNVEASMMSKSATSSAESAQKMLADPSTMEKIFPLYDQLSQKISLPLIFYYIMLLFLSLQLLFTSMWEGHNDIWGTKEPATTVVKYINSITYFKQLEHDHSSELIRFIVYIVLFVLTIAIPFAQYSVYSQIRRFNKISLYPTRFYMELVVIIMIHPTANFIGDLFLDVVPNDRESTQIAFFFILLVYFLFQVFIIYLNFTLFGNSPFIPDSPLASYNITPLCQLIIINSIFHILTFAVDIFPEWLLYVFVAIHIIVLIKFFVDFLYRPFYENSMNVYMDIIVLTCILWDIERIAAAPFPYINSNIYGAILVILLVLSIVVNIVIYIIQQKYLKKKWRLSQIEVTDDNTMPLPPNEDEKIELYKSLKLESSLTRCQLYLSYALSTRSDLLTDFSFIKFIIGNLHDNKVLNLCIRITALFPGESRLLNIIFAEFLRMKTLTLGDKFLAYQIQRLKFLRQSSSSISGAEKLKELIQKSKECEHSVRMFWIRTDASESYLSNLYKSIAQVRSLWDESLVDFPNSCTHSDEYCHFLIECATDFTSGIMQKHRAELIETGHNFCVDVCFRHFMHKFPQYLKMKVLDLNGNIIKKNTKGKGSSSASKNDFSSTGSSLSTLDAAVEEGIGKVLFNQARLRLALQNATKNKQGTGKNRLICVMVYALIIMVACSVFIVAYYYGIFDERGNVIQWIEMSNRVRLHLYSGSMCLMFTAADEQHFFEYTPVIGKYQAIDKWMSTSPYLDFSINWREQAIEHNVKSRDYYDSFTTEIAELASTGVDVYTLTANVFNDVLDIYYCTDSGVVAQPVNVNLKTILSYMYMSQSMTVSDNTSYDWFHSSKSFCTVMRTSEDLFDAFTQIRNALSSDQTRSFEEGKKTVIITMAVLGPLLFIVTYFPLITFLILYRKEISYFAKLLIDFDTTGKKGAMKPLLKSNDEAEEEIQQDDKVKDQNVTAILCVLFAFLILILVILVEIQLYTIFSTNQSFENLGTWTKNARRRKTLLIEMLMFTIEAVLLTNSTVFTHSSFTNESVVMNLALADNTRYMNGNNNAIDGVGDVPSMLGHDETIDYLTLKEQCTPSHETGQRDKHELYRCGSTTQLYSQFHDMLIDIRNNKRKYGGRIDADTPCQMIHLVSTHLIPMLAVIDDLFTPLMDAQLENHYIAMIGFAVGELALCFIIFGILVFSLNKLDICHKVLMILLRRLSPIDIVANKGVMNYLLNRKSENAAGSNITAGSIIKNSEDSILLINISGVIETINTAMTSLLGYTPDQLLGQPVSTCLKEDKQAEIMNQMDMMKSKSSPPFYENHTTCIADDDSEIPCFVTLLGMEDANGKITSFVAIFRNESVLIAQQQEAEIAKKKSENLLYQILPRDIVIRLNQGEKDISFSVPSSTIMFIDIVKFSEYASALSPQEIMGNLSMLFGAFDEALQKYDLLYKIKLIGDVYMCAGGLFSPDEPPVSHAEQMIRFGLDCLQVLDDTNIKLNASLQVRIGINTGGPLIAGVLGTDKPVFDIIGDPINIASRLQSTDYPGAIQISEATYNLVIDSDFTIESRGEVFLKGKGKQMAYLVKPNKGIMFQLSSSTDVLPMVK